MRRILAPLLLALLLVSCQQKVTSNVSVILLDGEQTITLATSERLPANLLVQANLTLGPHDRLLYLGQPIPLDQPLPVANFYTLQIRRAVSVTVITPGGAQTIETSAFTVGEVLGEAGYWLYAGDFAEPPVAAPITAGITITYRPARPLIVTADGLETPIRSTAATVGQALAEAGIPLIGLDYSLPAEDEPLPADGRIRIVRVVETVALTQKSLPFQSRFEASAELELDQTALLQAGEAGLAISRRRVHTEDGVEISRKVESETIVRPPQDRILGYGTRIEKRTAVVDGITIEYWRALQMFATSYSPCRSGVPGHCYYYTSSGKPVQRGVVAMLRAWYYLFQGQPLYIPGYGRATVEDVGGGFPDGRYWIDLGWTDEEYQPMTGWMTVYFLTPVPADPVYILP